MRKVAFAFGCQRHCEHFCSSEDHEGQTKDNLGWQHGVRVGLAASEASPSGINPSSFLDIFAPKHEELYMSKRDASTYFDSLVAPQKLQPWFGQQPVQVKGLVQVGLSLREIASWVDNLDTMLQPHSLVFPVNVVWPMGFSWSPLLRPTPLDACASAGRQSRKS